MSGTEMIERAFAAFEVAGDPTLLPQGVEIGVAPRDQLVGIGLVTHVPDHTVAIQIKGLVQRESEFHNTQSGTEMPTAVGHHFQMTLTDLGRDILKLCHRQTMQLIGMR